jgi:uncharacterized membrane protein
MTSTSIIPNLDRTERIVTAIAGGVALAAAATASRGRVPLAAASAALLARAATGYCPIVARTRNADSETKRRLGGPRGAHLQAQTRIERPPHEVYAFWRDLDRLSAALPRFVSATEIDAARSEWSLGDRARWTAEIINDEPGKLIGWQTLSGADIVSAGSVRFNDAGGNATDLVVHMQYSPPFGRLGASLAELFGKGANEIVEESLAAAKQAIERTASHSFDTP